MSRPSCRLVRLSSLHSYSSMRLHRRLQTRPAADRHRNNSRLPLGNADAVRTSAQYVSSSVTRFESPSLSPATSLDPAAREVSCTASALVQVQLASPLPYVRRAVGLSVPCVMVSRVDRLTACLAYLALTSHCRSRSLPRTVCERYGPRHLTACIWCKWSSSMKLNSCQDEVRVHVNNV
jgi:hypothetical protein